MKYYQDVDICKNVYANIGQCKRSLFGLLGPAYAYKCLLSPIVHIYLWRAHNLPVLRSGLSALLIRPDAMGPLNIFYNEILRIFLNL